MNEEEMMMSINDKKWYERNGMERWKLLNCLLFEGCTSKEEVQILVSLVLCID